MKNQESVADILVVDDTMENLDVLVSMLSEYGYNVRPAPSGEIALMAARSIPPDLILLDIKMPDMDGYEVCRVLKDDERTSDIPIIFLTVLDEATEKVKAFAAGAVDYITKPFQGEEVTARVKIHLRLRNMRQRLQEQNAQLEREIAEKEKAEAALRGSEERFELALKGADLGLWDYNLKTGEAFINDRRAEMVGYSVDELEPHVSSWGKLVHPDDMDRVVNAFNAHVEGRTPLYQSEHRLRHKSGEYIWVLSRAKVMEWDKQGYAVRMVGISRDITDQKRAEEELRTARNELERRVEERTTELRDTNEKLLVEMAEHKQSEEALRESEQRFRALAEGAPLGIVVIKEGGAFQYINPKFKEMFGYALEDVPNGREWFRRAYPNTEYRHNVISTWIDDARIAKIGQVRPRIFTVTCRDGTEKIVSFIPLSLPSGEEMVTCEDITEKRRAEELAIRTERLKAIGDLAGGVAHNFNNLLQMVVGGLDLALVDLEMGSLFEVKKTVEELLQISRSGTETVRRLQSFAQIRGEIQSPEREVFDLSKTVEQAAEMTRPFWKTGPDKEGISVALNLELAARCFVNAKESEILEVLVNLVKNASEALPKGGEIRIRTFFQGDQVMLQVADNGVGIRREHLKKVFEPFWSTKGASIGTGMGLAVSHGIISRHGGTISVESEDGKGTTFTVTLPLAKETLEMPIPSGEEVLGAKLNILVVDDMGIIVMHLKGLLTKQGNTVYSAKSGEEALEIFRNNKIDVVICDLGMPGMNGWEVGKAIRAICRERGLPKTPFILLTGWGGQQLEQEKILESAVDAIVEKPINHKKLMVTVREAAERVLPEESERTSPSEH
ncbi:MAG TPA: response regulator [Desulfomonilaceae bacterium]|nr:response regulator [Desulfomonilaceae bacterium]